jgi:hypothetical protein
MQCPQCLNAFPRARLLTARSGRAACAHCLVRVRPRLKHKGAWLLALLLAQAINLSALWMRSPGVAEAMLALGSFTTVLIGLMALYSFRPVLVE